MKNGMKRQAGAATMILVTILLFATTVAVFYLNRGLIFEQKTSAGQSRSTTALEIADAGIEWATAMLNTPYDIDTTCAPLSTTNISFRRKYVQTKFNDATSPTSDSLPATNVFPGCKISATGSLTCGCPAVPASGTATASLGTTVAPGFTVSFAKVPVVPATSPVTYDTESVRVTSYGCTAQSGACTATTSSNSDAYAAVTVILKLRPLLRAAPAAAVTCGTNCNFGGSFSVVNTDLMTNGILVNSGQSSSQPSGMTSLPGQPVQNALVTGDSSLSSLSGTDANCNKSNLFNAYFGSTITQYQNGPTTKTITCSSAQDCGSQTTTAYNDGWRAFYYTGDVAFNNSSFTQLGSAADPVTIVAEGVIKVNGNSEIYGLLFSNAAQDDPAGTGNSVIHGALVTCAELTVTGHGTVMYDPAALNNVRRGSGLMVRVPGSWRDF